MDENKVVEQNAVETVTTQTSSPQVEQPITGAETTADKSGDQGLSTESTDVAASMTEEQRRAFQEMRRENKQLKEKVETKGNEPSAFASLRPQVAPVHLPSVQVEQYKDSVTGEVNWTAFNAAQQMREQQVIQNVRVEARSEVQEIMDEEKARTKYPELMNDPKTEKLIASQWFYEKMQGRNVPISQIASEFARNFKQAVSKAEKVGVERALTEVSQKEQAALVAQSQSSQAAKRVTSSEDTQRLSMRTRRGDQEAVTARIAKIPWANK